MIRGGRSYVTSVPVFSNDAKTLLVCSSSSVLIFSTSTGLQVASLEGHTALVTSVIVVPATSKFLRYCWTASLDGTIRYWDFAVAELIKTIDVKFAIYSMVIPYLVCQSSENNDNSRKMFAYISVEDAKGSGNQNKLRGKIMKCDLTNSHLAGGVTLAETVQPESISVCPSGQFFGIKVQRRLHIWKVPSSDSDRAVVKKIKLHHTKNITTVAFHPSKRIVAAGDSSGRILIWRHFGEHMFENSDVSRKRNKKLDEEQPGVRPDDDAESCTTWHWHSSELSILCFSSDGAYLYSGGKEGVLVVWQLDTGKKKFLPRIGASVLFYAPSIDPSLAAISCADNQIHLMKLPSMEIVKSISGITAPCAIPKGYKAASGGLSFNEMSGLVSLRRSNYCIQLYSLLDDRSITEVQVCERNHQPGDEITVTVTLAVLSYDSSVMVTVEEQLSENGLGGLVCLKFWASESQTKVYNLTTVVYEPHGLHRISAVAFHPNSHMAVSSSYGGDFKVWLCQNEIQKHDIKGSKFGWSCHAVGSYKKKPMTAACFSHDGSVLAVAAETVITLWEPVRNILVSVVGHTSTPIRTLNFAGNSGYLVSSCLGLKPQLSLWNMFDLSPSWSYRLQVEAVATTTEASLFAVLVVFGESTAVPESTRKKIDGDGIILLFNVSNPVPLVAWLAKKAKGGYIGFISENVSVGDKSLNDEKSQSLLTFVNADHEYLLFDPVNSQPNEFVTIHRKHLVDKDEADNFGYTSIYGKLPDSSQKRPNKPSFSSFVPSERPWESIFHGSSHNLPLTKLCSQFFDSLLEKRPPMEHNVGRLM